jgi:hypothetical protein
MIAPPEKGPSYLVIEVTPFSGCTIEAKRRLYAALVEELEPLGIPAGDIKTVLIEVDPVNWGLRGLASKKILLANSMLPLHSQPGADLQRSDTVRRLSAPEAWQPPRQP